MVSTAGGIVIAIVVLLIAAAVGWVVFTQMRARRLGLPPPGLSSYLPWRRNESPYGPPQPAPGGVVGWFNDQVRKVKNRNNRSAAGAYEQPLQAGAGGRRGFGPLDPDEAWDARVGHEADAYGYFEEPELGKHGRTEYSGGGSYNMNLAATPSATYNDEERGRQGRNPGGAHSKNPFDDDAASSLRGVSPRPIDTADAHKNKPKGGRAGSAGSNPTDRRSVFRENV
ncbi:hypothetical protein QQS21_006508 [Conoideocrella luteorostrata]|uniref:Acid phosphatase-like protein n=1 Tax=Conoideocrella luteorostrata TaxID=1105319 RepID=A0AAJ0FXW7_9HYPO|nr:hypothetical protein QQS21_006508 [Conoideocrella luteorostrata]